MNKRTVLILLFSVLAASCVFAEESITITTYYPSPYGSYNQVEVQRGVTYKPIDKDTITDPQEGELVYDSGDDELYLYNGSSWVAQGGSGGGVVTLVGGVNTAPDCPTASGWTEAMYGYWNCVFPGNASGGAIPVAVGECFCGSTNVYETYYTSYKWSAISLGSVGVGGGNYRCRVCVK